MIVGKRAVYYLVGDAPTAAKFHGPDIHFVHLGRVDPAVRLLDQDTLDSAPAQIGGESKPDRSPADDQHRCFMHSNHSQVSLFLTKSCRKWGAPMRVTRNNDRAAPSGSGKGAIETRSSCKVSSRPCHAQSRDFPAACLRPERSSLLPLRRDLARRSLL
jgi:hypothetical protein